VGKEETLGILALLEERLMEDMAGFHRCIQILLKEVCKLEVGNYKNSLLIMYAAIFSLNHMETITLQL
jgi:hypothetical protein